MAIVLIVVFVAFAGVLLYIFFLMPDVSEDEEKINATWQQVADAHGLDFQPFDGHRLSITMSGEVDGQEITIGHAAETGHDHATIDVLGLSFKYRERGQLSRPLVREHIPLTTFETFIGRPWPRGATFFFSTLDQTIRYSPSDRQQLEQSKQGEFLQFFDLRSPQLSTLVASPATQDKLRRACAAFGDLRIREGLIKARLRGMHPPVAQMLMAVDEVVQLARALEEVARQASTEQTSQSPMGHEQSQPISSGQSW